MSNLLHLAPELLFNILDYTSPFNPNQHQYPLNTISATCRQLRDVAEEYARVMLKKHANITFQRTRRISYRKKWRMWVKQTCQGCMRKSQRRAILHPDTTLCKDCDNKMPKYTMTYAAKYLYVSKLELFTPNFFIDLPPLTFGTCMSMGMYTTMILESDVLARKEHIIKLLESTGTSTDDAHLKRRVAAHERILQALDMTFYHGEWRSKGSLGMLPGSDAISAEPSERRRKYAKDLMKKEWKALGIKGVTEEDPIEL